MNEEFSSDLLCSTVICSPSEVSTCGSVFLQGWENYFFFIVGNCNILVCCVEDCVPAVRGKLPRLYHNWTESDQLPTMYKFCFSALYMCSVITFVSGDAEQNRCTQKFVHPPARLGRRHAGHPLPSPHPTCAWSFPVAPWALYFTKFVFICSALRIIFDGKQLSSCPPCSR